MKNVIITQLGSRGNKGKTVKIGNVKLHFSYTTLIGLEDGEDLIIIKNYWNNTTGGHLNAINKDKKIRLDRNTFDKKISEKLNKLNITLDKAIII